MCSRLIRPRAMQALWAIGIALFFATSSCAQSADSLYGPSGVSPMAVRQGVLGSCFFHASLAAVAKVAPTSIRNSITGNGSGGYRVHFLSGPEELVYPLDIEYAKTHNYDRSEGQWVPVLMRGYAQRELRQSMIESVQRSTVIPVFVKPVALSALKQSGPLLLAYDRAIRAVVSQNGQLDKARLRQQLSRELSILHIPSAQADVLSGLLDQGGFFDDLNRTVQNNGEVFGAYRSLGQGGIPSSVFQAFLVSAHSDQVTDSSQLIANLNGLRAGTAMVAGTRSSSVNASDWFVPKHAYTVLDYSPGSRTVTLRNPWGSRPGPDGVFTLPLAIFQQSYEIYTYSDRN